MKISDKQHELISAVAEAAKKTYYFLMDKPEFQRRAVFLGRDATPVSYGVRYLDSIHCDNLKILDWDISSKLVRDNWENFEPQSRSKGHFITRLNQGSVSQNEVRNSLFWQYVIQERLIKDGKINLLDNGINGTLLSRINKLLHIADPNLKVQNVMLYYTGAVEVDNMAVLMGDGREDRRAIQNKTAIRDDIAIRMGELSRRSTILEGWPHPYPSASHYYVEDRKIKTGYTPDHPESLVNWESNKVINQNLLKEVVKTLSQS